jgi:spermidine/putrescine transport system substrate-binding protein
MEAELAINVLCWEGYDDPALMKPYTAASGSVVGVDTHLSDFDAADRVLRNVHKYDLVNINSPYIREVLFPRGKIRELDAARFGDLKNGRQIPETFSELRQWGLGPNGECIGVCQRFGPFNLVINTASISVVAAEDAGFDLAIDLRYSGRYGVLAYDDFNVLHIAIACKLDPYERFSEHAFAEFSAMAFRWFSEARMVTSDYRELNRALVSREIDFYLGGGIYTASSARREGHSQLRAITPRRGPVQGRGGIAFVEVNALLTDPSDTAEAEDFLRYLLHPETAPRAALANNSANPVLQMSDTRVFSQFGPAMLDAMQWDTLEEELGRCAQYRIAPDYARLRTILLEARTAAGWPQPSA